MFGVRSEEKPERRHLPVIRDMSKNPEDKCVVLLFPRGRSMDREPVDEDELLVSGRGYVVDEPLDGGRSPCDLSMLRNSALSSCRIV
jgi:hypothetical protein